MVANRKQFSCSFQQIFQKPLRQREAFCLLSQTAFFLATESFLIVLFPLFHWKVIWAGTEEQTAQKSQSEGRKEIPSVEDFANNQTQASSAAVGQNITEGGGKKNVWIHHLEDTQKC